MAEQYANNAQNALAAAIDSDDTSFAVSDGSAFPTGGPFRVIVGAEIMVIGSHDGAGNFSSVTRGAESTTAAAHDAGATVTHILTAEGLLNLGGSLVLRDTLANRPSAGREGRLYSATDDNDLYRDNGSTWDDITPAGSGGGYGEGCRLHHDADQSITTSTWTSLLFNTELWDSHGFHSAVSNSSRITIPAGKAGIYLLTGNVEYPNTANNGVRMLRFLVNGEDRMSEIAIPAGTTAQKVNLTTLWALDEGDYVELQTWQNQGSSINVQTFEHYSPVFSAVRVGPFPS